MGAEIGSVPADIRWTEEYRLRGRVVPHIAFVFPGQSAHQPWMASPWALTRHRETFDLVGRQMGQNLMAVADDAEACAAHTDLAQPAIYAASLAAFDALADVGVFPGVVAGHSLGEVTAAVAAGVLSREDGAKLVVGRGRAMARACAASPGTMVAILGLSPEVVDELLDQVPDACLANINTPEQVVVAGPEYAVNRTIDLALVRSGRSLRLEVEGAFHSSVMTPAVVIVDRLLRHIDLLDPTVPVVSGIDGLPRHTAGDVGQVLIDGMLAPVRWLEVQEYMSADEVDLLVEVGPGGNLADWARRTVPHLPCLSVSTLDDVQLVRDRVSDLIRGRA